MDEPVKRLRASAKRTNEFFIIETYSGFRRSIRDPMGKQHLLPATASAAEIGEAVRDALAHSRFLSLEEVKELLHPDKSAVSYESWVTGLVRDLAYESRVALFTNMKSCSVSQIVGQNEVLLSPTRHTQLEGWDRSKDDGIEDVTAAADGTNQVLGEAMLLAFSRCL